MQLDKTTKWPENLKVHKSAMLKKDFTDFQLALSDNILFSRAQFINFIYLYSTLYYPR